jgi:hypothetical protein
MRQTFTNRSIGAGLLGLSCILSSADACPAQGQDRNTLQLSSNGELLLPTVSLDSAEIDKAMKDLKAGIVTFPDLPPALQRNETVLVAAINNFESATDALVSLSREHLDSPAIRKAIGDSTIFVPLSLDNSRLAPFWATLFSHPTARDEILPQLIALVEKSPLFNLEPLLKIIDKHVEKERASELREQILRGVKQHYLASDGSDFFIYPPPFFRSDREVTAHYIELVCRTGRVVSFNTLLDYGLQESEAIEVYERLKANPATELDQLIFLCPDKLLLGSWKGDYLKALQQGVRPAIGRLNSVLIEHPEIAQTTTETIKAHPDLLNAFRKTGLERIHGLGEDHPFAKDLYQQILQQEETLEKIVTIIRSNPSTIRNFPDVILEHPHIRIGVQKIVNDNLFERGEISLAAPLSPQGPALRAFPDYLEAEYIRMFPELISLIDLESPLLDSPIFLYNPGALLTLVQHSAGRTIPESCVRDFLKAQEAGRALGIFEFGRFDNAYEIFRNRYQVASAETQDTLRSILGEDYFKDISAINKPLCVIINPSSTHDHNGAFLSNTILSDHNPDVIDSLTIAHHVLYFEASDEVDVIKSITSACDTLDKQIDLLILGGHGHSKGISLGDGNRAFDESSGQLGVEDLHLLSLLSPKVKAEATIILESCSTAGGKEDSDNVAQIVHRAIPHAHVYGPKSDTALDIRLSKDGSLGKLDYLGGQQVHIGPSGVAETESYLASKLSDLRMMTEMFFQNWYHRPLRTLRDSLLVLGILSAGATILKEGRSILRPFLASRRNSQDNSGKDLPEGDANKTEDTSSESGKLRQLVLFDIDE